MKQRVGVADLGTNTFHLVIREFWNCEEWVTVAKDRQFVHLGENGVSEISRAAFARGITALKQFAYALKSWKASSYRIIGTAALRKAKNRDEFVATAKRESGLDIEIISGDKEGSLIYKGVRQSLPLGNGTVLVMDIGGGSVEFIIGRGKDILWVESLPLGSSLTYHQYHRSEPIASLELKEYKSYIKHQLDGFYKEASRHEIGCLVGASGSFDTLVEMQAAALNSPVSYPANKLSLQQVLKHSDELSQMTLEQRMQVPGMSEKRAALMVVAVVLIQQVLQQLQIKQIWQSEYALKEGVLLDLFNRSLSQQK